MAGAQDSNAVLLKIPERITIETGLNNLELQVTNNGGQTFMGEIKLVLPDNLHTLGTEKIAVTIPTGKNRFITQRLQGQTLAELIGKQLQVELWNTSGKLLARREVKLDIPKNRSVILQDISAQQYLKYVGDSIRIKMRVINNGTTDEQLTMLFTSPDRIGNTKFQQRDLLSRSGEESLLVFSFAVEKYMLTQAQYSIGITGLYENNDVFGNLSILLSNIAADRNYQQMFNNSGSLATYSRNFIDLQMDNVLGRQQSFYLQSEGEYRLANGKLRYSAYLTKTAGVANPSLSNTYATFTKEKNTYSVGNIQESMEAAVYGRGVKYDHLDTSRAMALSVGVLQRTIDLLDYTASIDPGYTVFGKLVLAENKPERRRYEGQLFYDRNGLDSTSGILWTNSFDLLKQKYAGKMLLRGFIAAGLQPQDGKTVERDSAMPSWAFGLRMDRRFAKWSMSSDNFYSSSYYTGNRRGALQFVERLNRNFGKLSTGASFTFYRYNPSYLNTRFLSYSSQSSRWDLSAYIPLSSFANLSLMPSYNLEKGNYAFVNGIRELGLRSWRVLSTINLRSRNLQHNFNITAESGLVSMADYTSDNFALRADLIYNFKSLGLSASYQRGAFQIADLVTALLLGRSYGNRFSLGSRLGGALFHNRLQWTANARANLSESYGNSFGGNASLNYRVRNSTLITGLFQYNFTVAKTGYDYDFNNLRIGIRQNIKGANLDRPVQKTGNIRFFCFYDENFNGQFDKGEKAAVDHSFTVRGILFVSDKSGYASFKKLPFGSYLLFSPRQGQYMSLSRELEVNQSNTLINVPLQRGGVVKGSISIEYTPGFSLETDLSLDVYRVLARDENGKITEIRTDREGHFEVGLPMGTYSFYLDSRSFPVNVYSDQEAQIGMVKMGADLIISPLALKVKSKKVNVKRFGQ